MVVVTSFVVEAIVVAGSETVVLAMDTRALFNFKFGTNLDMMLVIATIVTHKISMGFLQLPSNFVMPQSNVWAQPGYRAPSSMYSSSPRLETSFMQSKYTTPRPQALVNGTKYSPFYNQA